MTKHIEVNSVIDQFDIIDFCRVCSEAIHIDDLVAHTADIAARHAGIDAVALVMADSESRDNIIVGTQAPLAKIARLGIRAYGAHLLKSLNGVDEAADGLSIRQIQGGISDESIGELGVVRVVWSINFGPTENPTGAIAFFSHHNSGLDANHLRGIEAISPIIASAINRIRSIESARSNGKSESNGHTIGVVSISHVNIIDQVFGHEDAQRVVTDVIRRMANVLPIKSRIARLAIDQLAFTIPATQNIDIRLVAKQIEHDCADLEIANSIQIKVEVITAEAIPAQEAGIHPTNPIPTKQQGPSIPVTGDTDTAQVG